MYDKGKARETGRRKAMDLTRYGAGYDCRFLEDAEVIAEYRYDSQAAKTESYYRRILRLSMTESVLFVSAYAIEFFRQPGFFVPGFSLVRAI